jgi:hypothetical protein
VLAVAFGEQERTRPGLDGPGAARLSGRSPSAARPTSAS